LKGRYRVMKLLGEGGMGAVFQAHDLKLGTDVALKMLRKELSQDPKHRARVYREVKLAQLVSHRNVARIYDLQEWDSHEFISMECIKGQTLAQRLGAEGALRLKEGCAILGQLCSGLAAAHVSNVVHRDLKPSNIMLEMGGRVVILDFGIARYCELLHTGSETRDLVGSPIYMAPEQFEKSKEVDHRADIYSLGVVAYEMFTGTAPFKSDNPVALAYMHVNKSPPDPLTVRPDLPPRLVAAILRCLQKSPDSRFGSVVEVASLLSIRA
jgi:serine/threonine protein kinase